MKTRLRVKLKTFWYVAIRLYNGETDAYCFESEEDVTNFIWTIQDHVAVISLEYSEV